MKKTLLLLVFSLCYSLGFGQSQQQQFQNMETFAKLYGYVKYFHPTDEAYTMDWDKFAIYGSQEVIKCKNQKELHATLKRLFMPMAPSLQLASSESLLTEIDQSCKMTYWQHLGLGYDATSGGSVYQSSRVGAMMNQASQGGNNQFANLMTSLDAKDLANKYVKMTAQVKSIAGNVGEGRLWLREDKRSGGMGFFDNMAGRPVTQTAWETYTIEGQLGEEPDRLVLGCLLIGSGAIAVDDFKLYFRDSEGQDWTEFDLHNASFESSVIDDTSGVNNKWSTYGQGYNFDLNSADIAEGSQAVLIQGEQKAKQVKGRTIFSTAPDRGASYTAMIGKDIYVRVPLTVCIDGDRKTYPKGDAAALKALKDAVAATGVDANNLETRLGNVVNTYNIFQHFFPYFDQTGVDWYAAFTTALNKSFSDKTAKDHIQTVKEFTAQLKDGHVRVNAASSAENFAPEFVWEVVEGQLVITKLLDPDLPLKVGDVVTSVNGQKTADYLADTYKGISFGTDGWRDYRAKTETLRGEKGSTLALVLKDGRSVSVTRSMDMYSNYELFETEKQPHKKVGKNSYYVNLDVMTMDSINALMPKLEQASGLIFDLRGYPKGNHELISHLLKDNDYNKWMYIPEYIYPDQKDREFRASGWNMSTKKPYLGDKKVVFLIDGSAISYAESYMGFIKGYKLATIVGQPTAGANGNVNRSRLPGGITISWTGMRVLKHNGDQHHAVGVQPDVFVTRTVQGIQAGRDEFMDKAMEIIGEK
ncbi:S41 family peptidase [Gilvibacter sediminis]|uniref:S41 family peptidase n=1 Tax=Gilvibacter sediminis TaxID=379071 RepID=UPI00234FDBEB|nr:S41 family peptidase [Gilvibacter sediminis]MDC7996649.1 S41 family peptidase [Gilvibacter sediminis]